jgi:homoserine kinase
VRVARRVHTVRIDPPEAWRAIVALPAEPLATSKARAVLPPAYTMEDVVANLQSAAILGLVFAQARGDLLRLAMNDRIHQPYRAQFCPLLPLLLPLVGKDGILGVALSGAGPAVLVVIDGEGSVQAAISAIEKVTENHASAELAICRFSRVGASQVIENKRFP